MKLSKNLPAAILFASLLYPTSNPAQSYFRIVRENEANYFELSTHEIRFPTTNMIEIYRYNGESYTFDFPSIQEIRFEDQISTSSTTTRMEKLSCVEEDHFLRIVGSVEKAVKERILIYSPTGGIVKNLYQPLQEPIAIDDLAKGVYILQVKGENIKFIRK